MAIWIKLKNQKNPEVVKLRNTLVRSIRENLQKVTIHENEGGFKNYTHIIFIGLNFNLLSDIFKELKYNKATLIFFNVSDQNVAESLENLIKQCVYAETENPKYLDRVIFTWNHREVLSILSKSYPLKLDKNKKEELYEEMVPMEDAPLQETDDPWEVE